MRVTRASAALRRRRPFANFPLYIRKLRREIRCSAAAIPQARIAASGIAEGNAVVGAGYGVGVGASYAEFHAWFWARRGGLPLNAKTRLSKPSGDIVNKTPS